MLTLGAHAQRGSVCVSVIQNHTNRPTNDTTYLTGNEGKKICGIFSETCCVRELWRETEAKEPICK